jgi:hypothetical protein
MAERALDDLYQIMADQSVGLRNRLNAAISASRVEPLSMPGEPEPQGVRFLRWIIETEGADGLRFSPQFRRESAAALAYYQRRAQKAQLLYNVADADERRETWRRILNGALRVHLGKHGHWPQRTDVLLTAADKIDVAGLPDPELVLSALLLGGGNRQERRRRQRTVDERVVALWSGTEEERRALIRPVAKAVHQRLLLFGLAS